MLAFLRTRGPRAACALPLALVLLAFLVPWPSSPAGGAPPDQGDHVPDELLVGFRDAVTSPSAEAVYVAEGAAKLEKLRGINVHRIRLRPSALSAVERKLRRLPQVAFVERNRRVPVSAIPNDPYYGDQWHLARISAPGAWDVTTGAPDIVIAILDSGVDPSHPDLAPKLVAGWNFYNNNGDTSDVFGHGTRVAGTAAAMGNDGVGVAGVAMRSGIMPVRVTDPNGFAFYSTIANGLTWAVQNGARVMNISFAGIAQSSSIRNAAEYVRSHGGLVVAAAGNCGCFDGTAENPWVISVSATTAGDGPAGWSSQGNYIDLAAPGEGILTTNWGSSYTGASGTSFSSPIAAGVIALMMAANPGLAPDQVEQMLKANADDLGPAGWDPQHGWGRINAHRAVAAAAGIGGGGGDTIPPAVSFTSPGNGATVSGSITVAAWASDNVGVSHIEFFVDGGLAATTGGPSGSFSWNTVTVGDGFHTLTARAYDGAGNVGTSSIGVSVANPVPDTAPPAVGFTSPGNGSTVAGSVTVTAVASDDVGVTFLEFLVDGSLVATTGGSSGSFIWDTTTAADGPHSLTARAYDAAGNVGSNTIAVTVDNAGEPPPDTQRPTLTISSPPYFSTVSGSIGVVLDTSDNVGVATVDVYFGITHLARLTSPPWHLTVNTWAQPNGLHPLIVGAADAAGNTTWALAWLNVRN
jgi:thermitase